MSYMSSEVLGDAEATKVNLWFLEKKMSRLDGKEYLYVVAAVSRERRQVRIESLAWRCFDLCIEPYTCHSGS